MSTRKPTELSGASDERDAVRAYLRRQIKSAEDAGADSWALPLKTVLNWLNDRAERYRRKAGGLGRTRKAAP